MRVGTIARRELASICLVVATRASVPIAGLALVQACEGDQDRASASGGTGGTGGGGAADSGAADGPLPDAGCAAPSDCDDGIACTLDSCVSGVCAHKPGPNIGVTACPSGTHCETTGCAPNPVCANTADCKSAWGTDPCKANISCNAATATCEFSALDNDGDGHAPVVCGGDDCDDSRTGAYPGATEQCDGVDDDCDNVVDNDAKCPNPGEYCQAPSTCACKPENICAGGCVDTLSDASNCGACGKKCPYGKCVSGACSCANGLTWCGTSCVDTLKDVAHCGACGKSCSGGNCANGTCGSASVELATFPGIPGAIAVAEKDVWVISDAKLVYKVPKAGGALTQVATLGPSVSLGIAVDQTNAYWVDGLSIMQAPLGGGAPTVLFTKQSKVPGAWWVGADGTSVFWFDNDNTPGWGSHLSSVPVGGGTSTWVATTPQLFSSFAVTSAGVFYAHGNYSSHQINRIGSTISFTDYTGEITGIAAVATQVWWAVKDKIRTSALSLPKVSDFFQAPGPIYGLVSSGTSLIWLGATTASGDQSAIGVTSTVDASTKYIGGANWYPGNGVLAADQTHAYWAIPVSTTGPPQYKYTTSVRRAPF